jgi:hypothetical protein
MEAQTGAVTFPSDWTQRPRRSRLAEIAAALSRRRAARAERAHSMRVNGPQIYSVPGSEHSHLIHRPRGF